MMTKSSKSVFLNFRNVHMCEVFWIIYNGDCDLMPMSLLDIFCKGTGPINLFPDTPPFPEKVRQLTYFLRFFAVLAHRLLSPLLMNLYQTLGKYSSSLALHFPKFWSKFINIGARGVYFKNCSFQNVSFWAKTYDFDQKYA